MNYELNKLIQHPELMDRETLYDLRSLVALHPYHQVARLLMLKNLFILHDPTFDEELRTAAFYITDRTTLFNMVEAKHYVITPESKTQQETRPQIEGTDRTDTLITNFLDSVQEEEPQDKPRRKPTPADAAIDYMAYLMEVSVENEDESPETKQSPTDTLIDRFLDEEGGKMTLQDHLDYAPHKEVELENDDEDLNEDYYTENLAKIYIKQGRYSTALGIIKQLNLNNSKKSIYFADQMRFLEKIILNEKIAKRRRA